MKTIGNCLMGCLGLVVLGLLGFIGLAFLVSQFPQPVETSAMTTSNIKFISGREDPTTPGSYMEVFVAVEKPTRDELQSWARERKAAQQRSHRFYFAVLFDDEKNVAYPNNPFTAFYGVDDIQKHILAHYECTNFNSFSDLTIGGWNTKPDIIQIQ